MEMYKVTYLMCSAVPHQKYFSKQKPVEALLQAS